MRVQFRERDGTAVAERLLAGEFSADALVCANDELALAVMARLRTAASTCPGTSPIVGWDDVMTARYVRPGLTTVRQPVQRARRARRRPAPRAGLRRRPQRRAPGPRHRGGDPQLLRLPTAATPPASDPATAGSPGIRLTPTHHRSPHPTQKVRDR